MHKVTWKCSCGVYEDCKKRFTPEACGKYFEKYGGIDCDPFPFGKVVGDQILGWPILQCADGNWRPEGIEECSFFLGNSTVMQLIARDIVYVDSATGHLRDRVTRYFPVLDKAGWDGQECNQCGICCAFPRPKSTGGGPCQYLQIDGSDEDRATIEEISKEYAKKDKLGRFSKDGKFFTLG